jgi:hypothetical protein
VSATSKADRPLSHVQFWIVVAAMAISGVLALVVLANVAGPHGACPSETQTSHPAAATCNAAYVNQGKTGVVG